MNNLNIFYFDNEMGKFDEFNPRFVMEQKHVKNIIRILAYNEPYSISVDKIADNLEISEQNVLDAINLLKNVSAIKENNNKLALNFPFFTTTDCKLIKKVVINSLDATKDFWSTTIQSFSQKLGRFYPNIDEKISLYHILCGKVFDGSIFNYLEKRHLLKQSYPKNNGRDFIIIGYENSNYCNKFNSDLFCSFNHARSESNSLSSFGNAHGNRFDFFRYFKLREKNGLYGKFCKIDKYLKKYSNPEITSGSLEIIKQIKHSSDFSKNEFYLTLKDFDYINNKDEINVPIFDNYIEKCSEFSEFVFEKIGDFISKSLTEIRDTIVNSRISCVRHGVNINELCNELWHIYFGLLNKFLIEKKIVASPQQFYNQGKYLKCIYLSKSFR